MKYSPRQFKSPFLLQWFIKLCQSSHFHKLCNKAKLYIPLYSLWLKKLR
jgi:hypothetical protein